jgi:hopanoid biosynthesis associated protein HpnK
VIFAVALLGPQCGPYTNRAPLSRITLVNLIITADDFGRSSEINAAVLEAHQRGVLTSASLMVAGDAFEEAVDIARRTPTLAVGLHVVLVDGNSVLPAGRLPRITDEQGRFPNSPARLGVRYFFDPRARRQVAEELAAQFSRFAETGLKLAHVDGHQHMHVHPAVFPLLIPLARRYGAGGIRLPRDELRFALRYDSRNALRKIGWAIAFGLLSRYCQRLLRDSQMTVAQHVYGLMQTGRMEEAYVVSLLEHMRGDSAEIYFHPTTGVRMDDLGPNPEELATLLSQTLKRVIASRKFRLCAYPDLSQGNS